MLAPGKIARTILLAAALSVLFPLMSCSRLEEPGTSVPVQADREDPGLYLFDYNDVAIDTTSSIGTKIKNCNIYLDIYGDLIVLGELENISGSIKTDMEITMDFMGHDRSVVHSAAVPLKAEYLRKGAKCPFSHCFTESTKYIELSSVKIGVNYRDHNDSFEGNPIVQVEDYYYRDDYLNIEGSIINIGGERIKDLLLLCTFYDNRDRVVFVKECHLPRERMMAAEEQDFSLEVLLDDYLKRFTTFHFEIFFADEIRVNV